MRRHAYILSALLTACSSGGDATDVLHTETAWIGEWPCSGCDRIEVTLSLDPDAGRYHYVALYQYGDSLSRFEQEGPTVWADSVLRLAAQPPDPEFNFRLMPDGELVRLGRDGGIPAEGFRLTRD